MTKRALSVYIVDSDMGDAKSLQSAIESMIVPCTISRAYTLEIARDSLDVFQEELDLCLFPDVLVLDPALNDGDGLEIIKRIRADNRMKAMCIVLYSLPHNSARLEIVRPFVNAIIQKGSDGIRQVVDVLSKCEKIA